MNGAHQGPALETRTLTKRYRDVRAVDGLDLRVARGEIYAFIGLNGAGKTTTIRALLGMIRPTSGHVRVLGETVSVGRGPWSRVGCLVEEAAAYPELSVRENLEVAARLQGAAWRSAADQIMERLGLAEYADRRARTLSTGNRQRLALARALLHQPELLILDEPANGLDPAGVAEVRELLRDLVRDQGATVFLSSHMLTELERLATRAGIIHQGRLIDELTGADMRGRTARLVVDARDRTAARALLERAGHTVRAEANGALALHDEQPVSAPEDVARLMTEAGTPPTHLAVERESLEALVLRLTQEQA